MAPSIIENNEPSILHTPLPEPKPVLMNNGLTPLITPLDTIHNLSQLLIRASATIGRLSFYSPGNGDLTPSHVSYSGLFDDAKQKARLLRCIDGFSPSSVVLLHFDSYHETIRWFWAATLAGVLPAISTPFVHDEGQRKKHLRHLQTLLQKPIILTMGELVPEFLGVEELRLCAVDTLRLTANSGIPSSLAPMDGNEKKLEDIAILMLTSGSTGNAKAVPLRHGQILKSVQGKTASFGLKPGDGFFNWIGLDHVAGLVEVHIHAMSLGSDQVHAPAAELLRDPLQFIRLLDTSKAAYTFAPNFFLTMIRDNLVSNPSFTADLSRLKVIMSGGEANVVITCDTLTHELRRFGIRHEVIRPAYGLTETCAGAICSKACPSYDLECGFEFTNVGKCIPGIDMRVMCVATKGKQATCGEVGDLQVTGPVVFDHYFNNTMATAESFTPDGWFITGDLAWIDAAGNLIIAGRNKDTIIVNGVKWSSTEIETAIEEETIPGLVPTFVVAFPHRAANSPTEDIAVVYSHSYAPDDLRARFETSTAIAKTVALITGQKPTHLIPVGQELIHKSTLGKISRTKVRSALESGKYAALEQENAKALKLYQQSMWRLAETPTEKLVQSSLSELLEIADKEISLDSSIFDLGITSLNLILLKSMIQGSVGAKIDIPMSVLLTEPTVGVIASSVDKLLSHPPVYNPIVPLQPHGSKTPLFCIHPGNGDIFGFIALAAHFPTRPVYALRARGYNPDERLFGTFREIVETYTQHVRLTQPKGPYAIAGYSYGSIIAYEIGKLLEAQGQEVCFLAIIDCPPYIANYIRNFDWIDMLMYMAYFFDLIDEPTFDNIALHLHTLSRDAASAYIVSTGNREKMRALAMDADRLARIADISANFRDGLQSYEPTGKVERMDIFVANSPAFAAKDKHWWIADDGLRRWTELSRSEAEFHDCPGNHKDMLNPEHMVDFARIFKAAMKRRGV